MKVSFRNDCRRERGYVLLVLLLFVALLSIGTLTLVEKLAQQIKRDREEELIHRGTQYSRAIRRFIVAFQRYPSSIEELESTNHIRFLRKRYKDPITGKDFRILRLTDAEVAYINPPAVTNTAATSASPQARNPKPEDPNAVKPVPQQEENPLMPYTGDPDARDTPAPPAPEVVNDAEEQRRSIGGIPIVGVVSTSHAKTIREFHTKNHYNQWLFIYNPGTDPGAPIRTPDQPPLNRTAQNGPRENGEPAKKSALTQEPNPDKASR